MRIKKERIYYYPYEYKGLQQHFQEMAQCGWQLYDIVDRNYYMVLMYTPCVPQTLYYNTDFCDDSSYFLYGVASKKTCDYVSFVESYGYRFVVGCKGLMVYVSDTCRKIPLRDECEDTQKQLRKATYKSTLFPLLMMIISFIGLQLP